MLLRNYAGRAGDLPYHADVGGTGIMQAAISNIAGRELTRFWEYAYTQWCCPMWA